MYIYIYIYIYIYNVAQHSTCFDPCVAVPGVYTRAHTDTQTHTHTPTHTCLEMHAWLCQVFCNLPPAPSSPPLFFPFCFYLTKPLPDSFFLCVGEHNASTTSYFLLIGCPPPQYTLYACTMYHICMHARIFGCGFLVRVWQHALISFWVVYHALSLFHTRARLSAVSHALADT
jgi:hypothetical protein